MSFRIIIGALVLCGLAGCCRERVPERVVVVPRPIPVYSDPRVQVVAPGVNVGVRP